MKLASLLIALVLSSQVFAQAQTESTAAAAPEASSAQAVGTPSTENPMKELKHSKKHHKAKKAHHKSAKKHKKKKHAAAAQ